MNFSLFFIVFGSNCKKVICRNIIWVRAHEFLVRVWFLGATYEHETTICWCVRVIIFFNLKNCVVDYFLNLARTWRTFSEWKVDRIEVSEGSDPVGGTRSYLEGQIFIEFVVCTRCLWNRLAIAKHVGLISEWFETFHPSETFILEKIKKA